MVKKKISFWVILMSLIIILVIFAGYKNVQNHFAKEYKVVNNKILESAKECFLKNDCEGIITLKDLYDKKYLDIQVDPKTKENIDDTICIIFDKNETKFCEN